VPARVNDALGSGVIIGSTVGGDEAMCVQIIIIIISHFNNRGVSGREHTGGTCCGLS
jgi:hypothetical protein